MASNLPNSVGKMSRKQWKIQLNQIRRKYMDRQDDLLVECRKALLRPGVKFSHVANIAGLSPTTVSKLAHEETIRPAFLTVLQVLSAMGYTITVSEPTETGKAQKVIATAPPFKDRLDAAKKLVASVH